ncbi:hypothetical protein [Kitasatospora sp. NPDC098663]|uniref:hypothetical protein n=1 Tax=Kitasatospora sp. NPDC098663 TaxID=3364096 RepID=UPI0038163139
MAQTDEQARVVAQRAEALHTAIHAARTPDQIREVCQAAAADYTAQHGRSTGQGASQ